MVAQIRLDPNAGVTELPYRELPKQESVVVDDEESNGPFGDAIIHEEGTTEEEASKVEPGESARPSELNMETPLEQMESESDQPEQEQNESEDQIPLLFVDVNLGNDNYKRIVLYEGDDPEDVAT